MKVKSESAVAQLCPTLSDPIILLLSSIFFALITEEGFLVSLCYSCYVAQGNTFNRNQWNLDYKGICKNGLERIGMKTEIIII